MLAMLQQGLLIKHEIRGGHDIGECLFFCLREGSVVPLLLC